MGLIIPNEGGSATLESVALYSNTEFGVVVTAGAGNHVKGSPSQLVGSVNYDCFGCIVGIGNVGLLTNSQRNVLVDIMIGANGSEQVLIPNLIGGNAAASTNSSMSPVYYYFPIKIPAGSRISARSQSNAVSYACNVQFHMIQNAVPGRWYGSRVTGYGVNTSLSRGTLHTSAGSGTAYATTTQLTASCDNPVKALQVGIDLGADINGNTGRGVLRIAAGSSTNYIVDSLPFRESTTVENIDHSFANFILSQMQFDIPAGSYLGIGAMQSTGDARSYALYGVD